MTRKLPCPINDPEVAYVPSISKVFSLYFTVLLVCVRWIPQLLFNFSFFILSVLMPCVQDNTRARVTYRLQKYCMNLAFLTSRMVDLLWKVVENQLKTAIIIIISSPSLKFRPPRNRWDVQGKSLVTLGNDPSSHGSRGQNEPKSRPDQRWNWKYLIM